MHLHEIMYVCHVCMYVNSCMHTINIYISCYNISRTQEQKSINKNIISFFYLLKVCIH